MDLSFFYTAFRQYAHRHSVLLVEHVEKAPTTEQGEELKSNGNKYRAYRKPMRNAVKFKVSKVAGEHGRIQTMFNRYFVVGLLVLGWQAV